MLTQENTADLKNTSSLIETDLHFALNNISDMVLIKDKSNNILFANHSACDFMNKSSTEVFGKNCSELFSEEDARKYYKDDLKIIEGVGPKIAELLAGGGLDTWAKVAAATPEANKDGSSPDLKAATTN